MWQKKWKVKNTFNKVIFSYKVTKNVTLYFLENVLILSYFQRSFVLWKSSDEFGSHRKMLRLWTLECSELVAPWKVCKITSRYSHKKVKFYVLKVCYNFSSISSCYKADTSFDRTSFISSICWVPRKEN